MNKILSIGILLLFLVSCKSTSNIVTSKEEAIKKGIYSYNEKTFQKELKIAKDRAYASSKKRKSNNKYSELSEQMINTAKNYLGVPYKTGGMSNSGMDCSGLVTLVYNKYEIAVPRTSSEMATVGEIISAREAQKGDLIFFKTNGRSSINHVGIISDVNEDEIKFIHASTSSGVIVSSTKESYYQKAFAQINRVVN